MNGMKADGASNVAQRAAALIYWRWRTVQSEMHGILEYRSRRGGIVGYRSRETLSKEM